VQERDVAAIWRLRGSPNCSMSDLVTTDSNIRLPRTRIKDRLLCVGKELCRQRARGFSGCERKRLFIARSLLD